VAVSFIGGRNQEYPKKTTELSQVTDYYKMKILKDLKCFLMSDISNETNNVPFAFPVCKNMNFVLMRIFCEKTRHILNENPNCLVLILNSHSFKNNKCLTFVSLEIISIVYSSKIPLLFICFKATSVAAYSHLYQNVKF
jgi:hypothetical protein